MTDSLTGKTKMAQLGLPRSLYTIYDTNKSTAYAAGQWQRIQQTKDSHPYLLYQLGPNAEHRPEHQSFSQLLLSVDDPFW
ncbi:phage minor head protein [Abyssogena phaseoliformis symbiont]|uniref:phage minor head protein n=1 Tax=Abyssogena phaseoliformis symbiont TaxID=596095 RepID=UPI0019152D8C|nr:phage minor head protein [Abyssogena phaseoliformis symbiont]